jgi:hypothetical protein
MPQRGAATAVTVPEKAWEAVESLLQSLAQALHYRRVKADERPASLYGAPSAAGPPATKRYAMKNFTRISLAAVLGLILAAPALRADNAPAASTTPATSAAPAKTKHAHKGGKKHHMKKAASVTPVAGSTDKK